MATDGSVIPVFFLVLLSGISQFAVIYILWILYKRSDILFDMP